jgi:hypothetical protein
MPRRRWAWITEVWHAILGDRSIMILLVAALILFGAILVFVWR